MHLPRVASSFKQGNTNDSSGLGSVLFKRLIYFEMVLSAFFESSHASSLSNGHMCLCRMMAARIRVKTIIVTIMARLSMMVKALRFMRVVQGQEIE